MSDSSHISAAAPLEFFRELVQEALSHQKLSPPESVEFYLVNLLKNCLFTQKLYGTLTEGFRTEPLAFIYCRAVQADSELRAQLFKQLGDFSLFISGFFPDSLEREAVGVKYYIQMGENAYGNLSRMGGGNRTQQNALGEIFDELSNRFVSYVDILSEVSEKSRLARNKDLLRLYENWLKTGSQRSARLLSEKGILPIQDLTNRTQ